MFCSECGKEVGEGKAFCPHCGAPQRPAAGRAETPGGAVPPPPQAVQPPTAPSGPPVVQHKTKTKKRWLLPVIAGAALLVAAAVALVLVLVVFKGGGGPESTLNDFLKAIENKDYKQIVALIDPEPFKKEPGSKKAFIENTEEQSKEGEIQFEGVEFESKIEGDEATVKVTSGRVKVKDKEGKTETEDAREFIGTSYMVKKDGTWYLSNDMFADFWAKYYLKKADSRLDAFKATIIKETGDIQEIFSTSDGTPPDIKTLDEEFKVKSAQASGKFNRMLKEAEATRSGYEKVTGLDDVEDYKEYANLRIEQVDNGIKLLETFKKSLEDIGAYISSMAASPPADPNVVTQGLDDLVGRYSTEIQTPADEFDRLDQQAEEMKGGLGL